MMQSQVSISESNGLGQWGAIAAAAMSAGAAVYSAKMQKEGMAAQQKAQKEIAAMQQKVEMEKVRLMKRQAEMSNAPFSITGGGGMSAGATMGIVGAGVAALILVVMLARRK